jgi:hypothetical protein
VQDRFSHDFFDDVIYNFFRTSEALSRSEKPPDGMTEPILDISHYSMFLPKNRRSLARVGWISKMWRDGRVLYAQGFFDDTTAGRLAAQAARKRVPVDCRVSIVVFPDWSLVEAEGERRLFRGGNQRAWLDSIAMTAHPMDPGTQLEVKSEMKTTLAEDARKVLGDDAEGLIEELEAARITAKSDSVPDGALIKTEQDTEEVTMPKQEQTTTEVAVEEPTDKEEKEEQPEEQKPEALSGATIKATVAGVLKEMLPGIGKAIDERLQPIKQSVDKLATDMEVIKAEETAKVAAAIDNDGDWYESIWGNSVQRAEQTGAVKGEGVGGPEESKSSDYANRYGNKE